jgi:hypothetical protein
MAAFSKLPLSGSTNGKPIKVAATATLGTTIHTAVSGTSDFDEIWLYAMNTSSAAVQLTIEFGGATAPDQNLIVTVQPKDGLLLVVPGLILQNGLVVTAFASTADVVTLSGFVNRITA